MKYFDALLLSAALLMAHSACSLAEQSSGQSEPLQAKAKVDLTQLETKPWRKALERVTSTSALKSGHAQITLLRVILEGEPPVVATQPVEEETMTVNGVQVRITGPGGAKIDIDLGSSKTASPTNPSHRLPPIQASSIKLNQVDSFPQGGGMYARLGSGDFLVVEHINSTARRGGKDPVRLKTATHGQVELWVPVPPRGELGIYGDVVLPQIESSLRGRIVVDVRSPQGKTPRPQQFDLGLVTVGGPYGRSYPMAGGHVAATDLIAPGEYPILLPTSETSGTPTNRWTVRVEPGAVTYLTFEDPGEGEIRLKDTRVILPKQTEQIEALNEILTNLKAVVPK